MKINPKIFKAYDIRGIYPQDLNAEIAQKVVQGIHRFFSEALEKQVYTVGIGRDMRLSSPEIYESVKSTLERYGLKIHDLGLVSTPGIYYAALKLNLDGIIQITASHNPKEYNGLKFLIRRGDRLVKASGKFGIPKVKDYVLSEDFLPFSNKKGEIIKQENFDKVFVEDTLKYFGSFEPPKIKVVVDTANAMGVLFLKPLFERLGMKTIFINEELDGSFPSHEADPLKPKNLKQLQEEVLKQKADLGIAPDGDGDRIFFVGEKGEIIPPTRITSLVAKKVFEERKGKRAVVDVRYVRNVQRIAEEFGGEIILTRVGHAFITEKVNETKAFFAGESSGHYYFYDFGGGENSLLPLLYLLKEVYETGKSVSQIIFSLSLVYESGEINFRIPEGKTSQEVFNSVEKRFSDGKVVKIDGLTVEFEEWRFNFRASNTEPLIRLNLEADEKEILDQKLQELLDYLKSLGVTPVD